MQTEYFKDASRDVSALKHVFSRSYQHENGLFLAKQWNLPRRSFRYHHGRMWCVETMSQGTQWIVKTRDIKNILRSIHYTNLNQRDLSFDYKRNVPHNGITL